MAQQIRQAASDDPRRLRELVARTRDLAMAHGMRSVVVGLAGGEGDLLFPEFISFVESALRVEDAVFRMTRDRAVVFLVDVDQQCAVQIMDRLREDFQGRFPSAEALQLSLGYFAVSAGARSVTAKEILPAVFSP